MITEMWKYAQELLEKSGVVVEKVDYNVKVSSRRLLDNN